jgi:small GTP-binding protein
MSPIERRNINIHLEYGGSMANEVVKKNVILLGDSGVGKTSLIRRFVLDQFDERYVTTIGSKVSKKEVEIPAGESRARVVMLIWDIIGQREYELTQALTMRNIDGAILVSDLTRPDTLESLRGYWIPKIRAVRGSIPLIFLANKSDSGEMRYGLAELGALACSPETGMADSAVLCRLTSAKTGQGVEESFVGLASALLWAAPTASSSANAAESGCPELSTLANVVDYVISDFATKYGGIEVASPIVKHQMALAGLDPSKPTRPSVTKFIENMASVEKTFISSSEAQARKLERLQRLKAVKD